VKHALNFDGQWYVLKTRLFDWRCGMLWLFVCVLISYLLTSRRPPAMLTPIVAARGLGGWECPNASIHRMYMMGWNVGICLYIFVSLPVTSMCVSVCVCVYVIVCVCVCVCVYAITPVWLAVCRCILGQQQADVITSSAQPHDKLGSSSGRLVPPTTTQTSMSVSLSLSVCLSVCVSQYVCLCLSLYLCLSDHRETTHGQISTSSRLSLECMDIF